MEQLRQQLREAKMEVIAALVVATLALIVALSGSVTSVVIAKRDATHARQIAADAFELAKVNKALLRQAKGQTHDRRKVAHDLSVRQCSAEHTLDTAILVSLKASIADGRHLIREGYYDQFGPAIKAAAIRGLNRTQRLVDRVQTADCDPTDPRDVLPDPDGPTHD